jgi:hypothetical protein
MGSGYAAGQAGYMQMIGDIQKVLTVFGSISAAITANQLHQHGQHHQLHQLHLRRFQSEVHCC